MIEFVDFEEFYPNIKTEVARMPEPLIDQKLREAAIMLCEHAPVWRHEERVAVREGQPEYKLDIPTDNAVVHSVLGVWFGSRKLEPASHNDLRDEPGNRTVSSTSGLYVYHIDTRGNLTLFGTPQRDEVTQLRISTSLKPSRDAIELPLQFKNDYLRTLEHGTIGYSMMMAGRDWSNPELGTWHRARFDEGKIDARMATDRGFATGPQRLRRRQFVSNRRHV